MGTPDGYNTESPEHLHIIYAKRGWRASNKVRPLPQMVKFVQRYEAIRIHRMYIDLYYSCQHRDRVESQVVYGEDEDAIAEGVGYRFADENEEDSEESIEQANLAGEDKLDEEEEVEYDGSDDEFENEPADELVRIQSSGPTNQYLPLDPEWSIAVKPTVSRMKCDKIIGTYGALDFVSRTNEWLQESTLSGLLPPLQFITHDHTFDLWHKFYLHHRPLYFDPDLPTRRDTVRAQPPSAVPESSLRPPGPGRFDTVLFLAKPNESGIHRYRAGRIRVIFKLPPHLSTTYPHPLVYLELFTPFSKEFNSTHGMHTVSPDAYRGLRRTIVMPLVWVVAACHLVPLFSQFDADSPFDSHDVLSTGKDFFFNHYSSNFMFGLVDHWRMVHDRVAKAMAAERQATEEKARRARVEKGKAARARLVQVRARMESIPDQPAESVLPN